MIILNLNGTLQSKFAAHVPVFRRWKLIWERREFGTRVDTLFHHQVAFPTYETLPPGGVRLPIVGEWAVNISKEGTEGEPVIGVVFLWNNMTVPGTAQRVKLPPTGSVKVLKFQTDLWKGVKLDILAEAAF